MSSGETPPPRWTRVAIVCVALAVGLSGCGFALATLTVSSTPSTAAGSYFTNTGLTFWYDAAVFTTTIPATPPGAVSTTVGTPSRLSGTGTGSYTLNGGAGGAPAEAFRFVETTGAPTSTEIELTFTVSVGGSPATSTVTGYVETQTHIPGASSYFTFYFSTGTISITHATVTSLVQLSQQCTAVGTCP